MRRTGGMMSALLLAVYLGLLGTAVTAAPCTAGTPTAQIKATTDKILTIVSDPALKMPEKAGKRQALIRKAVDERFDWREMSRRTLARHWSERSEGEKEAFVSLFAKLLERTYMDKVEGYSGEEVRYVGEKVEGEYAVVAVEIITRQTREIGVLYRMREKGGDWLVYDISIEGVSLINNYRTQFNTIINQSSFAGLMERLRKKVEEG